MFVFYDTETTGISKDFTQILQIGLLFTDDDLNILSTKKSDCRNSPWELPAPGALLITGFTPDDLKTSKLSNYEMMQEVNDWLRGHSWPITFIGYNSIEYDEPILAQNFYQNLLDPNLTTSGNNKNDQTNGRADIMYMVETAALFMPGALKLDILNYYGSPSMTLKNVARQNGVTLSDADAHDALNDIKATVGVAGVIKKAAPQIWEQALKLSTAAGVDKFLASNDVFTFTRFMHGASHGKPPKSGVMTSLVEREGSTTQALFDLRTDPAPYLKMSVEQLKDVFLAKESERPFVLIRKEAQPVLMPMELSDAVLTKDDDEALYKKRAKAIKADKGFLDKVAKAALLAKDEKLAAAPAVSPMPELLMDKEIAAPVQAKLDLWAKEFREAANWHDRAALADGFKARFKDELTADPSLERFERLAARLVFEHAPKELTAAKQETMKKFIAARILNPDLKAPYMTIAKARKDLAQIEWLRAKPDSDKWKEVTDTDIRKLKLYYTAVEKEFAAYAPVKPAANTNIPSPSSPATRKPANGNVGPK